MGLFVNDRRQAMSRYRTRARRKTPRRETRLLTFLNPIELVNFLTMDGRIIRRSTLNQTLSKRKKIRLKVLKTIQNAIKRARREGFLYISYHLPWKLRHRYIKRVGPYAVNEPLVPLVQKKKIPKT